MGNLYTLQGRFEEAEQCHAQAYQQFVSTIGQQNHRTADTEHKLAEHLLRRSAYDEAIARVNSALHTYKYDAEVYKPELARTTFLKARIFQQQGLDHKAAVTTKVAANLRSALVPESKKAVADLEQADFDALVTFWSR